MRSELMFANGMLPGEKVRLVGSVLERLWPVDRAARFDALLSRIDDAVSRSRCRSRLNRFDRMLRRGHPG